MKNQYGPPAAKVTLRWRNGLFLPESNGSTNLEKLAEDAKADAAFLDRLDRFARQGRNVSALPSARNYAPAMFAKEHSGVSRRQLEAAMSRLFERQKIHVETYRLDGHPRQRLAAYPHAHPPLTSRLPPVHQLRAHLPLYRGECAERAWQDGSSAGHCLAYSISNWRRPTPIHSARLITQAPSGRPTAIG
jgi:hypothetical protein